LNLKAQRTIQTLRLCASASNTSLCRSARNQPFASLRATNIATTSSHENGTQRREGAKSKPNFAPLRLCEQYLPLPLCEKSTLCGSASNQYRISQQQAPMKMARKDAKAQRTIQTLRLCASASNTSLCRSARNQPSAALRATNTKSCLKNSFPLSNSLFNCCFCQQWTISGTAQFDIFRAQPKPD